MAIARKAKRADKSLISNLAVLTTPDLAPLDQRDTPRKLGKFGQEAAWVSLLRLEEHNEQGGGISQGTNGDAA